MRSLSPEEERLWARVASTIRPLSRDLPAPPPAEQAASEPLRPVVAQVRRPSTPALPPARQRLGGTLDGSWDKRLRAGRVEPDRVLDLHGMNLDGAWHAIDDALERAIIAGNRVILLITGHERAGEPPVSRGRIRAAVHDWLAASRHAENIAAVRGAHKKHGGGGSLYLILRRR